MIWQDVVLITIALLYLTGIIYQMYIVIKRRYRLFSLKNILENLVLFFLISITGIFMIFNNWILWWIYKQENPIPKTKTYTLNSDIEKYKNILLSLGFEYDNYRVSKDNIPYAGFVYKNPQRAREVWIILAIDKQQDNRQVIRLSSYKYTKEVNDVIKLVDELLI